MDYLLDTGATVNVMSWDRFQELMDTELIETTEILRCTNDSTLQIKGKVAIEVEVKRMKRTMKFTIVQHIVQPDGWGALIHLNNSVWD